MASTRAKVLFAAGLMKGTAAYWFEPIKRDYLREENEADRDERINRIFRDWDNIELVLREAFGSTDEAREALQKVKDLMQKGTVSYYCAEFQRITSRLDWDDEPLMDLLYEGLKEDVKDEVYKEDRPETLDEYMAMIVRINNRQYNRRKQKAAKNPR
jgi:hypothetical protein